MPKRNDQLECSGGKSWHYLNPHQLLISGMLNALWHYPIWGAQPQASTFLFWGSGSHPSTMTMTRRRRLMELTALKNTQPSGGEEETDTRWGGVSLAGGQTAQSFKQRFSNSWKAASSQAQPSAAKARLHLQRPHHSQVVWEELHFQNEVQMLLSKSIF